MGRASVFSNFISKLKSAQHPQAAFGLLLLKAWEMKYLPESGAAVHQNQHLEKTKHDPVASPAHKNIPAICACFILVPRP